MSLEEPLISEKSISHGPMDIDIAPYRILEFDNGKIVKSRFEFIYEDFKEPSLQILRKQENLDEVVKEGRTDVERMALLKSWVRAQWEHTIPDPNPPTSALLHLDWIRKGKTGGFCGNFTNVFLQCCLSLGMVARIVELNYKVEKGRRWPGGHSVTEVWSNDYRKWVIMDTDFDIYYMKAGVPLNALELHNACLDEETFSIQVIDGGNKKLPVSFRINDPDSPNHKTKLLGLYYNFAIRMSNNVLSGEKIGRPKVPTLHWTDERTTPKAGVVLDTGQVIEAGPYSNRIEDFYWTLNEVEIKLKPTADFKKTGILNCILETFTPNLSKLLVSVDDAPWTEVKPEFVTRHEAKATFQWKLHKGINILRAKAVNNVGVGGHVSYVKIVSGPPYVPPKFILKWGKASPAKDPSWIRLGYKAEEPKDGEFRYPSGIAVDNKGYVYVTDRQNHRVQKFTEDGEFVLKWGTEGSGDGQFKYPYGIAVDNEGYVYVADMGNCRVQKFNENGEFMLKWGIKGSGDGEFQDVHSIAVDNKGFVYVTDSLYPDVNRVQKFTSNGEFVLSWGGRKGEAEGEMHCPCGIAVDSKGYVYVVDMGNCRIQKFSGNGEFVLKWGSKGCGDGQFKYPTGIAIDNEDFVYVVDTQNQRIQKFTDEGEFLTKWGTHGDGDGQFINPRDIAINKNGFKYVVDSYLHRVQKYGP